MQILLVGYMHTEGGIRSHNLWLGRGLAARGHKVTIATPAPVSSDVYVPVCGDSVAVVSINSIRDILLGYPGGRETTFDVAVVLGTGWKSMIGPILNRNIRKRVFFEVMSGQRNPALDPRWLVHIGFDYVVGQARPVEACFRKSFRWRGPSVTLPALSEPLELFGNVVPPSKPTPAPGEIRACYFGRLAPHKGIGWMIENWERMSSHVEVLDIWGGEGSDEARIKRLIAERGLQDRVRLMGRYPSGKEYIQLLQNYDVELLPTDGLEGAPLVLLEAMACGLPFVANGVGGISDYDNQDCRVTSGDRAEFWPLLDSLCSALYQGSIDRHRLHKHYVQSFSYQVLCDRWEKFFVSLYAS